MDFFDVLKGRASIRNFKSAELKKEDLNQILMAANSAPSAGNLQSYEIVLVRDKEKREKLREACFEQHFVSQAPVVLVFCANRERASVRYGKRGEKLYSVQDATIACSYAQLATAALGLGSCWVGAFDEDKVREIIDAPDYIKPVAVLPIGYADEEPHQTPRRKLNDLVKEDSF